MARGAATNGYSGVRAEQGGGAQLGGERVPAASAAAIWSPRDDGRTAESQLDELRNMRVLLEEARLLARTLVYYRRARLEAVLRRALDEVDLHIQELRSQGRG